MYGCRNYQFYWYLYNGSFYQKNAQFKNMAENFVTCGIIYRFVFRLAICFNFYIGKYLGDASGKGLRPHMKTHAFYAWVSFYKTIT